MGSREEVDGTHGLAGLVRALRALGEAASDALTAGGDVRLHVIACNAHHLAHRLGPDAASDGQVDALDLDDAAQALRREVLLLAGGRPGIRPTLVQARGLVLLADAVRR